MTKCLPPHVLEARFWARTDRSGDCWVWTGATYPKGYGKVGRGRRGEHRLRQAHRVAYEYAFGPIPKGLCVLHRCDRPACIRPEHLFLGTQADNVADMVAKDRHSRGVARPGARLTEDDVREIRRLDQSRELGITAIGRQFGIHKSYVLAIRKRKKWRCVT